MNELKKALVPFKKQLILGPLFKWLEAILELFIPLVMASLIDGGIATRNMRHIWLMTAALAALSTIGFLFAAICQYYASVASSGYGASLREKLLAHIQTYSYEQLDQVGEQTLVNRLTSDVFQVENAVAMFIRLGVRAPFIIIGAAVMTFMIDMHMAFIFSLIIPLVSLTLYLVMWRALPYFKKRQQKLDEVSRIAKENLEGVRVIRAFSRSVFERKRFKEAAEEVQHLSTYVGHLNALLNPTIFIILNGGIMAILMLGGQQVNVGNLTQGQLIAIVSYTTQISLMLVILTNLIILFTRASASSVRISEVFQLQCEMKAGHLHTGQNSHIAITFENVSFKYDQSGDWAVQQLAFTIKKGTTVGIIGATGSGKTTLINLLARFYEATSGKILIEGRNIKDYHLNSLRKKIGIVTQKPVLFSGTVQSNLKMANEDATIEDMHWALTVAQANQLFSSLDATIEQNGRNLSGGQRQRLTIARTLLKKPDILILDDASSALDYATEAKLRQQLNDLKPLTTVIVSQRAHAIKHADHILVMDKGKLVGNGTHQQLLLSNDVYKEICQSQGVIS